MLELKAEKSSDAKTPAPAPPSAYATRFMVAYSAKTGSE